MARQKVRRHWTILPQSSPRRDEWRGRCRYVAYLCLNGENAPQRVAAEAYIERGRRRPVENALAADHTKYLCCSAAAGYVGAKAGQHLRGSLTIRYGAEADG
jgi:hypothetical protein